jgi:hypothetical protein
MSIREKYTKGHLGSRWQEESPKARKPKPKPKPKRPERKKEKVGRVVE